MTGDDEPTIDLGTEDASARKQVLARCAVLPEMRHAGVGRQFSNPPLGIEDGETEWKDTLDAYMEEGGAATAGKLNTVSRTLMAQALTLDSIFTNMANRAAINASQYPEACERYLRMALKAQANSRATMEALARMHQPREQTVKHVTVHEGGQAVVADHIHQHEGVADGKSRDQCHAFQTALPCPDPLGSGVPLTSGEGAEAVPHARRDQSRCA